MNKQGAAYLAEKTIFQYVTFMIINLIKCIQKKENEPQRAEKEREKNDEKRT